MSRVNLSVQVMRQFPNLTFNPGVCCCWTIHPSVNSCLCSSHWMAHIRHSKAIIYSTTRFHDSLFTFLLINNSDGEKSWPVLANTSVVCWEPHQASWGSLGWYKVQVSQSLISHLLIWLCRKMLNVPLPSEHVLSPTCKHHLRNDCHLGCGPDVHLIYAGTYPSTPPDGSLKRWEGRRAINCLQQLWSC